AAHAEARRLDPHITTGFQQTLLVHREIDLLLSLEEGARMASGNDGIRVIGLGFAGRLDEARQMLATMRGQMHTRAFEAWMNHLSAWLDRRVDDMVSSVSAMTPLKIFDDPEAIFQEGWFFCDAGEHQRGLDFLQRAVARGYFVSPTLKIWPQFDALRETDAF